jgi:hypothetical protein
MVSNQCWVNKLPSPAILSIKDLQTFPLILSDLCSPVVANLASYGSSWSRLTNERWPVHSSGVGEWEERKGNATLVQNDAHHPILSLAEAMAVGYTTLIVFEACS